MKKFKTGLILFVLIIFTFVGYAQKGAGNPAGVVRKGINPEIIQLTGKITVILTEPCKNTTGRSDAGTHIIIVTKENIEKNIHLGPAIEVSFITKDLNPGQDITCRVFNTKDLAENNYIAIDLETPDQHYLLRDADFQPFWSKNGRR